MLSKVRSELAPAIWKAQTSSRFFSLSSDEAFSSKSRINPARDLCLCGRSRIENSLLAVASLEGRGFLGEICLCEALTCSANVFPPRTKYGCADFASTLPFIRPFFLRDATAERNVLSSEGESLDFLEYRGRDANVKHSLVRSENPAHRTGTSGTVKAGS